MCEQARAGLHWDMAYMGTGVLRSHLLALEQGSCAKMCLGTPQACEQVCPSHHMEVGVGTWQAC